MKTKYRICQAVACLALTVAPVALTGCTEGFEDANRPGNKTTLDELNRDGYVAGNFFKGLQTITFPEQENDYQMNQDLIGNYLGRYFTYANPGFREKNFVLGNAPEGWAAYPLRDFKPKVESNFNNILAVTKGEGAAYAMALAMRANAYMRLTDTYGPVIISKMNEDGTPKEDNTYSSAEEVYKSILVDLDKAGQIIGGIYTANPSAKVMEAYDVVYGGSMEKWYKFVNSMKLRIAIRIRFVAPDLAKTVGEAAVRDGVITKNDDNLMMLYNPRGLYKVSVEWGDTRLCADLDSYMNGYQDPRLGKYVQKTAQDGSRNFIGLMAGAKVESKSTAVKLYSAANVTQDSKDPWMTAAEMAFCRAEGVLAGWSGMGGTAEELYNEGIRLSFEQWGASGADSYIANNTLTPADYVDADGGYGRSVAASSRLTVAWDEAATSEVKLERLMIQKWIALYPNGQEAWCELRRTGYPKVFAPGQPAANGLSVQNRLPFDPREVISNKANYDKAVQLLGGADNYATKLWWQR